MQYRAKAKRSLSALAVICVAVALSATSPVEPSTTSQQKPLTGVVRVNWVVFNPNGKTLASANDDNTVSLWDVAKRQKTKNLEGHSEPCLCVAFSPDGKTLASSSEDHLVKLWDVASGKNTGTLKGHFKRVAWVGFSPDGRTLASASSDGTIRIWEIASGKSRVTFEEYSGPVVPAVLSPDGKFIAFASKEETIKLLDAGSGKEGGILRGHRHVVSALAFSPDGKTLASGDRFVGKAGKAPNLVCSIILWDVATGTSTKVLERQGSIYSLVFRPDGKTLASSTGSTIKLWDVATGQNTFTRKAASLRIPCMAFSPDGTTLVSAGSLLGPKTRETVQWWDIRGQH